MARVNKGLDVSSYNPKLDYANIGKQIDFAILRAGFTGYGASRSLNTDFSFEKHYAGFTAQKTPLGVYYYSCADSVDEAIREAKYLLTLLKGKKFLYPIYMDVEDEFNQQKLTKTELSKVVLAFCKVLEDAGYYAGIYANSNWWTNELDQSDLKTLDRWVAHYGVPTPRVSGEMWQYTEDGVLNGHTGKLDLNYCYKDYPVIIQNAGLNGWGVPVNTPKILIKGEMVSGDVTGKVELVKSLMELLGFTVTVEVN